MVFNLERRLGIDPDDAWVLTVNAWLACVLSVGLVAALGVVVFWRLAMKLSGNRTGAALFATFTFAFATLYFPYATMQMDHDLVAVALLAAFLLAFDTASPRRLFAAGICAAGSIVASYLSVVAAVILGGYIVWRAGRARRASGLVAFVAGAIPPLALLAAYNVACFGNLMAMNYAWENPLFKRVGGSLLELFTAPRGHVLLALLVSPMRGLFSGTPVLVLGVIGLVIMLRSPRLRPEGLVCVAMIGHVLVFNMSFGNWNSGWACGPRYLVPALPFLALPVALVPARANWVRHGLLAISIIAMALVTIVDPQPPPTMVGIWNHSPIWSIDLPQWLHGRPGTYATSHWPEEMLSMYVEPVSSNPDGVYSGAPGRFFPLGSAQTRWNSFNVGEFLFAGRRLSVLPWLALVTVFAALLRRESARPARNQRAV